MKVRELIAALQEMPQDADVIPLSGMWTADGDEVEVSLVDGVVRIQQ